MNKRKYPQCYCSDCQKPILNIARKLIARCLKCYRQLVRDCPEANSNWKGGKVITEGGYVEVICRDHPRKNARNRVREHRLVMEKIIGRFLEPHEEVHHKDGDPGNNAVDNLVLTTNTEHRRKYHHKAIKCKMCGSSGIIRKGYCWRHYQRWQAEGFPAIGPRPDSKVRKWGKWNHTK